MGGERWEVRGGRWYLVGEVQRLLGVLEVGLQLLARGGGGGALLALLLQLCLQLAQLLHDAAPLLLARLLLGLGHTHMT